MLGTVRPSPVADPPTRRRPPGQLFSTQALYGATELNKRRQLALIWNGKVAGVVEIKSGVFNGLKIPLGAGVSEQDGVELQHALGHEGPTAK